MFTDTPRAPTEASPGDSRPWGAGKYQKARLPETQGLLEAGDLFANDQGGVCYFLPNSSWIAFIASLGSRRIQSSSKNTAGGLM